MTKSCHGLLVSYRLLTTLTIASKACAELMKCDCKSKSGCGARCGCKKLTGTLWLLVYKKDLLIAWKLNILIYECCSFCGFWGQAEI